MTPEQYERARQLFLAAIEVRPEDRNAYLNEVCTDAEVREEVASLLKHSSEDQDFLESPVLGEGFALADPEILAGATGQTTEQVVGPGRADTDEPIPDQIGQYRIIDVLGRGGMGVVYRAEQETPRRTVALKVIRPGVSGSRGTLKRFEHEVQVLGWLQHPGIAQVYDAGTAETDSGAQPFFAMELIEGEALTAYADKKHLNSRQRLEIVARICDAVHHAHQKGVVHRDLKPNNILVDATGQPKVLDFGVARVTDSDLRATTIETSLGQIVGTLAYMSPEQVEGESRQLDTRSDVYALGVIAYELLAGRLPLDVSRQTIPRAARTIAEEDPEPLSSIDRIFRGDVDTIIRKALHKDKNMRYQSASDLAADIRRYLSDEPINARPATAWYQLRKFARRNRTAVVLACVAIVLACGGVVRITWERNRAVRAEKLASQRLVRLSLEAQKVQATNQFLNNMLASADPSRDGYEVRVVEILDWAAERLPDELSEQPEIRAVLHNTIGTTYAGLGLNKEAEPHLRNALKLRLELHGESHADSLQSMTSLAATIRELGQLEEAEELVRKALDIHLRDSGEESADTLDAMNNLADVLQRRGDIEQAESLWRRALAGQRKILPPDHSELLITMNNLGQLLKLTSRPEEAEPLLQEAMEGLIATKGEEHPTTLACMGNLSTALKGLGRYDEAGEILRKVIDVRRRRMGDHPSVYMSISNLARLRDEQGRKNEAEILAKEARDGLLKLLGPNHPRTLAATNNLAHQLVESGRLKEAEKMYLELLESAGNTLPAGHWMMLVFRGNYGVCLTELQRYDEAESVLLESYHGLKDAVGMRHEHTRKVCRRLITLYDQWEKKDKAQAYREIVENEVD